MTVLTCPAAVNPSVPEGTQIERFVRPEDWRWLLAQPISLLGVRAYEAFARWSGDGDELLVTKNKVCAELGCSQNSVANVLARLAAVGLVDYAVTTKGYQVSLNPVSVARAARKGAGNA